MRINDRRVLGVAASLAVVAMAATACSSSGGGNSTTTTPPANNNTSSASTGGGGTSPSTGASTGSGGGSISAESLTSDFSLMAQLKPIADAGKGKGKIAVILPDTTTSARYTEFDAPLLKKAFEAAGLTSDEFSIQNAQGSDATQLTDAQAAITAGASVIVYDPLDAGVGVKIEKAAKDAGVPIVDYDRLTLGGTRDYYVSFDNVKVGKLIGQGLVDCVSDWGVKDPKVIEMLGSPTDNNATLFAQGYDSVLNPLYQNGNDSGKWTKVAQPAGTWDPPTALTEFTQAFTQHPDANALLSPNDENASPIIKYLKTHGVKAKTFPVTGQDATTIGLQDILTGYQCGTVYKPIALEAQGAAALALFLRAGQTPPAALANGTTKDTTANVDVPSVLLTPEWVTSKNMEDTVIKDGAVKASDICTADVASACQAAGIS